MLVYATNFRFAPNTAALAVRSAVAEWIARKVGSRVAPAQLSTQGSKRFDDPLGCHVEVWATASPQMAQSAIRVTHGDAAVSGRQWVVEVGLRGPSAAIVVDCSLILQTNEVSTLVTTPVPLSPPRLVSMIMAAAQLAVGTPGLLELPLTSANAEDVFLYDLLSTDRHHPVVIVSPTAEGTYLVNRERLRSLVRGIADVRVIALDADTFSIARSMKGIAAPHSGAITIVFPRSRLRAGGMPYWQLLRPDDLELPQADSVELAILARVLHRTNLPTSWRHISPAQVIDARRQEDSAALRNAIQSESLTAEELKGLFEQSAAENNELRERAKSLEGERDQYWFRAEDLEERLEEQQKVREQLNVALQAALQQAAASVQPLLDHNTRGLICDCLVEGPTVLSGLRLAAALFPDRLLVLPSAEKSAERHWAFKYGGEAFSLIVLLATSYWEALAAGKGDSSARKVFQPRSFSAKENDISKEARKARTFALPDGADQYMEPHLKIQKGPNEAESWRLHFEWNAVEKKIVIGHCGVHLPE